MQSLPLIKNYANDNIMPKYTLVFLNGSGNQQVRFYVVLFSGTMLRLCDHKNGGGHIGME